ncbi:Ig-like domain-containing protein [Halorubrum xinjiangense]|uniref:Ig-like domain-containing protein n=1 Tax=Halorubrum xinjiangense TaxID=261291 RepID=UPI003C6F592A
MRFSRDRRGQSVVVGTVILFGFLILALSLYQVQVVPQENADVEFEHSQQVEGEFLDLRNAVESASSTGDGRSTSLKLGTRYPQRTFALNPPPASGRLSTTEPRPLRIENVTVNDGGNVGAYWANRTNETATGDTITFDTRSLRYSPGYNEFRDGPDLVYEHSLVIAEFDSGILGRSGQTAVNSDRNRIRLTALDGRVSESGVRRTSLDPETLSENRRSVRLNSTGGDPIVVELPTDVSMERADSLEQQWRDRLGDDAESVVAAGGTVRIELNGTNGYRLELGKVGLGSDTTGTNESDGYITRVSAADGVAVAEVRDRYNNPVEGAEVDISVDGTTVETVRTDADGRVSYEVTDVSDVEMTINDGTDTWDSILLENVGAGVPDGGGGAESLLVAPEEAVAFNGPGSGERGGFQLDVENQHDTQVRITDVTVLPEDPRLDGLSDKADATGPGRSELNVESENGAVGNKEVLLRDWEYTFVPNSGLQLNLQSGPEKRAYDTVSGEYIDAETDFSGVEVPLNSGDGATITLAEFYEVEQGGATVVDVVGDTFSVTVGYKIDGERRTKQFVTTVVNEVTQTDSLTYNGDATTIGSGNAGVEFSVSNTGDETVDIDSVEIESTTSPDATILRNGTGNGQQVITVSGTNEGSFEVGNDGYSFGEVATLSASVSVPSGAEATISLTRFFDGGATGNDNYIDMSGESVTVTLTLSDGTQETFTVST